MSVTAVPASAATKPTTEAPKPALGTPAAATPAAATPPPPPPKTTEAPDAEWVKTVAKAQSAERKANKLVAEMQAKLDAATGSSTDAQTKAALFDAVKANPSLLLDHGVTWDQVLASISGREVEAPETPREKALREGLEAMQAKAKARDDAEAAAKEAELAAHRTRQQQAAVDNVKKLIADEGDKPDKDGFPRWAIVGDDPEAIQDAIDAVVSTIDVEVKKDPKFQCSHEDAIELVRQHLDQQEAHGRKRAAKLMAAKVGTISGNGTGDLKSKPVFQPRAELPPDVFRIDPKKPQDENQSRPRTRASIL